MYYNSVVLYNMYYYIVVLCTTVLQYPYLRRQWRPRGADCLERGEVVRDARLDAPLLLHRDPLGAGAVDGDAALVDQVPQHPGVRVERGAVVQDQGAACGQGRHLRGVGRLSLARKVEID